MRLAVRSLIAVLLLSLIAGSASASEESVRLGIEALDSDRPYFQLTLEPGESAELTVRFANHGEVPTGATVFPADVYTISGGGMGMRDVDEPQTGPTEWIGLETEDLELMPAEAMDQIFTVSVPEETAPGDYITSIVIQNTEPIAVGDDAPQFDQTVRQGVAVSIDVPGERHPSFEIGGIEHLTSGDRSVLEIGIANNGNTHLRPEGEFVLLDGDDERLVGSSVAMDTVYAGDSTVLEVQFESLLRPGDYRVRLEMADDETGAGSSAEDLRFTVPEPEPQTEDENEEAVAPAPVTERASVDDMGTVVWLAGTLAMLGLVALLAAFLLRQQGALAGPSQSRPAPRPPASQPSAPSPKPPPRPIRQLKPRDRHSSR